MANLVSQNKMGTEPVGKLLASMAWPAILSMTINSLYNIIDSIFVSMVSKEAFAAVSLVMPVQLLMISVAVGSSIGVNSLISRRLGAGKYDEADKAASTSVRIGVFNFIIFALMGIFLAEPFMRAYTDNPEVYSNGIIYFRMITCLCVFNMQEFQLTKVLQATGNMVAPMFISLSGIITNIILDPVLIFGVGPFPEMKIAGAALATVIGQFVSVTIAVIVIKKKEHIVHIKLKGFKLEWAVIKDIYAVGLPSMVMQSISSVLLLGYNAIIASDPTAVAVLGIYMKLQTFVFMPVFGLNQGAMPIMGYNYGAKNRERLMKTYRYALTAAFCIMTTGCLIFQLFPEFLLKLFNADSAMIVMGTNALRLISISFVPASFGIMTSTFFQGTGHGVHSLMASVIRQLVGILPLAFILYNTIGVDASWASFPMSEVLGVGYSAIMLLIIYRKEIRHLS